MKTSMFRSPIIPLTLAILILLGFGLADFFTFVRQAHPDKRKHFEAFMLEQYRQAPRIPLTEDESGEKLMDEPAAAAFQEYLMTLDPATGVVPRERGLSAYNQTKTIQKQKQSVSVSWQGSGTEIGGRTRAILFDPNDPDQKKVWAGGVTGGLWYTNDIGNPAASWIPISDFWPVLSIRCMTWDPNNPQIFYIGTGEPETALITYRESSGVGQGIWRSADGGQTWEQIPSTTDFVYITDLLVRDEGGESVIYAGVASGRYHGTHQSMPTDGLYRSADDGATWVQVLPDISGSDVPYAPADVEAGPGGRIFVGSRPNLDEEGGAVILYSDSGLPGSWTVNEEYRVIIENNPDNPLPGRVILAAAPSDENVVYALVSSGHLEPGNGFNYFYCYHILRSNDNGITWSVRNLPNDLTNGDNFATIAWHALDAGVDPNNPDHVYIGGLDVHHSFNGGTTWIRVSDWSRMYSGGGADYLHADQHVILFKPGSSQEILFGTDGGVFVTTTGTAAYPVFEPRNNNFNTLQYYTCAINPAAGSLSCLGGLQDNGSLHYHGNPLTLDDMWSGGDGAFCFFDEDGPALSVTSVYYNQYYIFLYGTNVNTIWNYSSGTFVSPADFDYRNNTIYANAVDFVGNYANRILRLTNITGNETGTFLNMGTGSNLYFSAVTYSPHSSTNEATLFIGNQEGRIFRVEHANTLPVVSEIGSPGFPVGNISCIAVGGSEDTLAVTFSNYGVPSVWVTSDGGQTWTDAETNLPDMPIRWAIFHPLNARQVMLATETGPWITNHVFAEPVLWEPSTEGLANVRVDMLRIRKSDHILLAATHGRGLFTSTEPWEATLVETPERRQPSVTVYPNPSDGWVTIHPASHLQSPVMIHVINAGGQVVCAGEMEGGSTTVKRLDLSGQPAGIYLLKLESEGRMMLSEKLILL